MDNLYEIRKYTNLDYAVFKEMVGECFNKDYKIPVNAEQLIELCDDIVDSVNKEITFLSLLFLGDEVKGFVNYQIDTPESDWCEKESWGCIRELFVYPDVRGKGLGKKLADYAENKLKELSVPCIYLTTDDTMGFWLKIGYSDTGEICAKNDGCILTKQSLSAPL